MHPISIAAIGLLLVNDHLLKEAWPGAVTGKLSDIAGLVFFPLLLTYVWRLVTGGTSRASVLVAIVVTGTFFSLIQVSPLAGDLYRHSLGLIQFPFRLLAGGDRPVAVLLTADPTDLLALPSLLLSWWISKDGISDQPMSRPRDAQSGTTSRAAVGQTRVSEALRRSNSLLRVGVSHD
jgi:hypothetical protein